jgi:hypothetical protein
MWGHRRTLVEKDAEDLVKAFEIQVTRQGQDPGHHGAYFVQNCAQNQSLEGCRCFHPSRLRAKLQKRQNPGFLLLSNKCISRWFFMQFSGLTGNTWVDTLGLAGVSVRGNFDGAPASERNHTALAEVAGR